MKNSILLEKNLKNFNFILFNFLRNENLTNENYYLSYPNLVKQLKQNFRQLKVILLNEDNLQENLNFMEVQTKKKREEYLRDVCDNVVIFEDIHFESILNYLKKNSNEKKITFRSMYISFFSNLQDKIYYCFCEKDRENKRKIAFEKNKKNENNKI